MKKVAQQYKSRQTRKTKHFTTTNTRMKEEKGGAQAPGGVAG
jgi:hypothetical protein